MRLRPATEADRDAVCALGVVEETAWFAEPESSAAEVGEWIDDEGGLTPGVVADDDGRVRGYASPGRRDGVFLADPALTDALADQLLPWLLERSDDVQLMTFAGDAARVAAFERHGLRHLRSSFSLVRPEGAGPLPAAEFPEGIEVAPYRLGEDDEAVHRLIYVDAAWAAVPGHAERDLETWREVVQLSGSLLLARRDGRPVGWVAGRLLDSGRGFVNTLAVAIPERGRGLGRALLLQVFRELEAAGARDTTLAVEAANENALKLYRSVGMEIELEWRVYGARGVVTRTLPDGREVAVTHERPAGDWVVRLLGDPDRSSAGRSLLKVLAEALDLPSGAKPAWVLEVVRDLSGQDTPVGRRYPCPCCDFLTLSEPPTGTFAICPACGWEDDNIQFEDLDYEGGANAVGLRQARENFRLHGASDPARRGRVRPPRPEERPDAASS
jgi:ribosomal protein S18 acetylase RimI-like enzyme